ncbi:MAG TPA: hypothetical protein VGE74_08555 [Gemmata sp.]
MKGTVTHIAGCAMNMGGRWIQRCSVCGEKLLDSNNAAAPLNPDGTVPEFPRWECGRLIQFTAGNPRREVMLPDSDRIPADSCLELVE